MVFCMGVHITKWYLRSPQSIFHQTQWYWSKWNILDVLIYCWQSAQRGIWMLATCGSLVAQNWSHLMYFSVLEGLLCLRMGWPPVFRNDTCFSDSKVCSCQLNVDCVSLGGCLLSSERPGAGRWLKKLTSATGLLLFSVRQFHSLVSQVNPPRAGLVAGYINASTVWFRETLWELLWANTLEIFPENMV